MEQGTHILLLILSATEVAGIHASTMLLSGVGIPLLRFHPHPSQCRSIGQAIGLTAYPPQRAAIFTMPLLTRTFPAYFRLRALFESSDISTTSEPAVPSGIVSFGPADPVCATHSSCKGSLTPRPEVGSLCSPSYGQRSFPFGRRLRIFSASVSMLAACRLVCFATSISSASALRKRSHLRLFAVAIWIASAS